MSYAIRIAPGSKVDLDKIETKEDGGLAKEDADAIFGELGDGLQELQELLYAAGTHSLLIVLQGRDTSGKDGTIKRLSRYVNIQGCTVVPFKVPTEDEIAHDFLWRVHKHAPRKGQITVFNRSHYEDVLVVRVHDLVPKKAWSARFEQINQFEELLASNNTIILKFCLHISKDEQEERLLDREKEDEKSWKLSANDWKERDLWDDYTAAYNDMLGKCSTKTAPWRVIPADRKWFRDVAVMEAVVEALRPYRKAWVEALKERGEEALGEIKALRKEG
jgi:PPK2 family polyphosphate:nucleotide phosphotransferase